MSYFLQIFDDKAESRAEELFSMQKTMEEDAIVTAHTQMKLSQQANANRELRERVEEGEARVQEVNRSSLSALEVHLFTPTAEAQVCDPQGEVLGGPEEDLQAGVGGGALRQEGPAQGLLPAPV